MKHFLFSTLLVLLLVGCGSRKGQRTRKNNKQTEKINTKKPVVITKNPSRVDINQAHKIPTKHGTQTEIYIAAFSNIAKQEMELYGIPASITIAQGILESASGTGRLAVEANNHFGIKCHDWTGDKIYHDDDLSQECFRKYIDAKYSFRDHSLFLKQRKRYANLFNLEPNDYKAWALGLKAAGYATDRHYPKKLIDIIERYELQKLDAQVLGITINNKPNSTHIVAKGETLYAIAKAYNMSVETLKDLNDLTDNTIYVGQILQINTITE